MEIRNLWEVLAIIVFLLAPLWRGIRETRRRAIEERERQLGPRRATPPQEDDEESALPRGLEAWEALLRGEVPGAEDEQEDELDEWEEPAPVPTPAAPPVPPPVVHEHAADEKLGALADSLELAEPALASELHSALEDRVLGGSLRPTLQPRAARPARRRALPFRLPSDARDWRTAVLLSEILGPPAALRTPRRT